MNFKVQLEFNNKMYFNEEKDDRILNFESIINCDKK